MLNIVNPATDERITSIETTQPEKIDEYFQKCKTAQLSWKNRPYKDRAEVVNKFNKILQSHLEDCARILSQEMGKPISQAKGEVNATLMRVQWFLDNTEKCILPYVVRKEDGLEEKISFEPLGIVGHISAWNYPYFIGTNVIVPALLTGNSVLYKPSEFATLTGLKIKEMFLEAGLDTNLLQMLVGGADVGSKLAELPINGLFFTGSYQTGKKIATQVGHRFLKLGMELGGKDPVYVCEDAKIDATVKSVASGALYNSGQSCCSVERIYVHEKIYPEFLQQFKKEVEHYKIGDPSLEDTNVGPLTRKNHREFLDDQVEDALAKGASYLVKGGQIEQKGSFYSPTILVNVDHSMKIMVDESFGPIVGIQKVSSDAEALKLMQDTEFGLTSSVYSENISRAESILSKIDSGTVYWNCSDRVSPYLPWSGRKSSGLGSTLSELGIRAFVHPKAWHQVSMK